MSTNNENIFSELALRLTEERAKLGFSQADFARKLGVTREGIRLYELGQRGMTAIFLVNAATLGVDVNYVLFGVRSSNTAANTAAAFSQVINGNISGVANAQSGSNVNIINTTRHVTKSHVEINPGIEHITPANVVTLKALVAEIISIEQSLKKNPSTYQKVHGALNAFLGVTHIRLIKVVDFERARTYLNQWIARLHSMSSAPTKSVDTYRKKRTAYIKINIKEPESLMAAETYMLKNFKTTHVSELANDELEQLYRYVASRRNKRKTVLG